LEKTEEKKFKHWKCGGSRENGIILSDHLMENGNYADVLFPSYFVYIMIALI